MWALAYRCMLMCTYNWKKCIVAYLVDLASENVITNTSRDRQNKSEDGKGRTSGLCGFLKQHRMGKLTLYRRFKATSDPIMTRLDLFIYSAMTGVVIVAVYCQGLGSNPMHGRSLGRSPWRLPNCQNISDTALFFPHRCHLFLLLTQQTVEWLFVQEAKMSSWNSCLLCDPTAASKHQPITLIIKAAPFSAVKKQRHNKEAGQSGAGAAWWIQGHREGDATQDGNQVHRFQSVSLQTWMQHSGRHTGPQCPPSIQLEATLCNLPPRTCTFVCWHA